MQSIALGTNVNVEIVSAYSTSNVELPGVATPPAWVVVGAFYMPQNVEAKIDALALVSDPAVTIGLRLFDMTTAAPVDGTNTNTINSLTEGHCTSGVVSLLSGHLYQFQAQVIGDPAQFGLVRSAQLT